MKEWWYDKQFIDIVGGKWDFNCVWAVIGLYGRYALSMTNFDGMRHGLNLINILPFWVNIRFYLMQYAEQQIGDFLVHHQWQNYLKSPYKMPRWYRWIVNAHELYLRILNVHCKARGCGKLIKWWHTTRERNRCQKTIPFYNRKLQIFHIFSLLRKVEILMYTYEYIW